MRLARVEANGVVATVAALSDAHLARVDWLLPEARQAGPVALIGSPEWRAQLSRRVEAVSQDLAAGRVTAAWLLQEGFVLEAAAVSFAPPVEHCSKVVCLALNYRAHASEGNMEPPAEPAMFLKAPSSLVGHGATVTAPPFCQRLDYEVELAVVIGQRARDLTPGNWQAAVAGYTIMNDVTARDLQFAAISAGTPWDRTKSFDTFGPVGPWLVTAGEIPDPQQLDLELTVGGEVRQSSNTRHMLFPVGELLVTISQSMTLEPGDIIATGTPEGIGPVAHGDVMTARISGLGTLANPVAMAEPAGDGLARQAAL